MPTTSPIIPVVRCTRTVPGGDVGHADVTAGYHQVHDIARVQATVGNRVGLDLKLPGFGLESLAGAHWFLRVVEVNGPGCGDTGIGKGASLHDVLLAQEHFTEQAPALAESPADYLHLFSMKQCLGPYMKTTIDLRDAILQRTKIATARRRTTIKNLVIEGLETVLSEDALVPPFSDALARLRHGYHLGGKPLTRDEAHGS